MARSFWIGHKVKLLKVNEHFKVKYIGKDNSTVTRDWMSLANELYGSVTVLFSIIVPLAYEITCVPVAAKMGFVLIAKKIALSRDKKSKKYKKNADKYLDLLKKDKAKKIQNKFDKFNSNLESINNLIICIHFYKYIQSNIEKKFLLNSNEILFFLFFPLYLFPNHFNF